MSFKTIIVLSSQFAGPAATLMNAACHLAHGLGREREREGERFVDYVDGSGRRLSTLSFWPLILLEGKPTKMWAFFDALAHAGVPHGAFVDTMIDGGSEVQLQRTQESTRDHLGLVAVAGFGSADLFAPLTKRFSVWRPRTPTPPPLPGTHHQRDVTT